METQAQYYDGVSSRTHDVRLSFAGGGMVQICNHEISKQYNINDVTIASRLGNTPRAINLPDGGKCVVSDNDFIDRALTEYSAKKYHGLIHKLENRLYYVAIAVLFAVVFSWAMVTWGIPTMARHIAFALPQDVDQALGTGTLDAMDRLVFEPSGLDDASRQRLQNMFTDMLRNVDDSGHYQLVFRSSEKVGANAFALPSGIIIITDELVELSENDNEIAAIIAHEIGHLVHRHSVRMAMQNSAFAVLVATITGDPFSTSSLTVALPTVLVNAQYSKEFEREADDYAYQYLRNSGIPLNAFADMLLRITGDEESSVMDEYLSSHPGTQERVQRFR